MLQLAVESSLFQVWLCSSVFTDPCISDLVWCGVNRVVVLVCLLLTQLAIQYPVHYNRLHARPQSMAVMRCVDRRLPGAC